MKYLDHFKLELPCPWLASAKLSQKKEVRHLNRTDSWIEARYSEYDQIIADHVSAPAPTRLSKLGKTLVGFYNNAPTDLGAHLHARRRDHGLLECPYCGNPSIPDTLDHFLPKDDWPEFAIFPSNLVPQCRDCMPIKGTRYYSAAHGGALFLHPIYNATLSKLGFKVEVGLSNGVPEFETEFSIDQSVGADDAARLSIHLIALKIKSRFAAYCMRQYKQWQRKLEQNAFSVERALSVRLEEFPHPDRAGNWEAAFLLGVLRNPTVVAELQKSALQNPEPQSAVIHVPLIA